MSETGAKYLLFLETPWLKYCQAILTKKKDHRVPSLLLLLSKVPFRFESQATKDIFKIFEPQTNFIYFSKRKIVIANQAALH